jgi:DNA-binding beta-propeller fold protein YncE
VADERRNSLLSGRVGVPDGAYRMLNDPVERAVENVIRNELTLTQLIQDQESGGTATRDWATFDEDGVVVVQNENDTLSCTKLSTGTYQVTRNSTFPAGPAAAPLVTPLSVATASTSTEVALRQWFTTISPDASEGGVQYDPVTGNVWATDFDHSTGSTIDRLAIGLPTSVLPEFYFNLPSAYPELNVFKGETLILDLTYRIAFVQVRNAAGTINTTLFVDMDTFDVLTDTQSAEGGTQTVLIGFSDDHLLMMNGSSIAIWSRDAGGLPDTDLGTYSNPGSTGSVGFKTGLVDNDGQFWFVDSAAPKNWEHYPISGGFAQVTHDAGADGIDATVYCHNPADNCIYFLTVGHTYLKKILCTSPYTITQINGTAYSTTYDASTADETIKDAIAMEFASDGSELILIRPGDDHPYLFLVDPTDGSIDVALSLPVEFSSNYELNRIAIWGNYIATIGNQYLQVINYVIAGEGSALTFTPPLFGSRMTSTTTAIVEFWNPEALPNKVKMDAGFHIEFARDP